MRYRLADCHVHLQAGQFQADLDLVLDRARRCGVELMLCNGSDPQDWQAVREMAPSKHGVRIVPFFGLHPWYVDQAAQGQWQQTLGQLLESVPSGVGEIGLDKWISQPTLDMQLPAFRYQLQLALDLHRPACIHCLRAWGPLLEQLRGLGPFEPGLIIHAYSGPAELIRPLIRLGGYFSFAGNCLHANKTRAHAVIVEVPLERILLESDAPDLPPPADRRIPGGTDTDGKYRNEPANLPHILAGVAQIRQQDPQVLADAVWDNAQRLLGYIL